MDLSSLLSFNTGLFFEAFILLFSIFDAIGTVPIFLLLTQAYPDERRKIVNQSVIIATLLLIVFAYLGLFIFAGLGITINDFKIAGGIVLFLIAIDNLRGRLSETKTISAVEVAAFPIATPLLAGPGAISSVIIFANPPYGPLLDLVVILSNSALAWLILTRAVAVQKLLGTQGTQIFTRIMGLLIAAIGVAFVRDGIVSIVHSAGY